MNIRQKKIYNIGLGVLKKERRSQGGRKQQEGEVNLGGASCMLVQLLWEFAMFQNLKNKKTSTPLDSACGLPSWLGRGFLPRSPDHLSGRATWAPRGRYPLAAPPRSLQGPVSQPGPLTGALSATPSLAW